MQHAVVVDGPLRVHRDVDRRAAEVRVVRRAVLARDRAAGDELAVVVLEADVRRLVGRVDLHRDVELEAAVGAGDVAADEAPERHLRDFLRLRLVVERDARIERPAVELLLALDLEVDLRHVRDVRLPAVRLAAEVDRDHRLGARREAVVVAEQAAVLVAGRVERERVGPGRVEVPAELDARVREDRRPHVHLQRRVRRHPAGVEVELDRELIEVHEVDVPRLALPLVEVARLGERIPREGGPSQAGHCSEREHGGEQATSAHGGRHSTG